MNKIIYGLLSVFVTFVLVLGGSYSTYGLLVPQSQVTSLPGTEGLDANTIGGRGGTIYEVTNPNDSGSVPAPSGWYRGNTHTHSQLPDIDDRATIAGWYKNAGYDFLLISDHNYDVNQQNYCPDHLTTATFLMICGVELSNSRHVTALEINQYISGESSLQDAVTRTLNAGGVPILNHPQDPVVSSSTFLSTVGLNQIEIVNGERLSQTPATEILWDQILSASNGRLVYGVAADDNHHTQSKTGRGWIVVRSPALNKVDILDNIRNGNFYTSTGIVLNDYVIDFTAKTITIDSQNGNTIIFIGNNGTILKTVSGAIATYQVTGAEKYVRAKITNTAGKMAWTQPIFVTSFPVITPSPIVTNSPTSTSTATVTRTPTSSRTPTLTFTPSPVITPTSFVGVTKHYTPNETRLDGTKAYTDAAAIGFNVHDTGMNTSTINALPAGSQALVWVGIGDRNCSTTLTSEFKTFVLANATNPRLYGFFLTDEPLNSTCVAAVTAYTKFIHDNAPGKMAFIVLTDWPGTYAAYRPAVTKVDLIGLDPYPVQDGTYESTLIPNEINDAIAAGIPLANIVPVFQTFGGAGWDAPTATQLTSILGQWAALIPNPPLDFAYSWGTQSNYLSDALVNRADWRAIMATHNNAQNSRVTVLRSIGLQDGWILESSETSKKGGAFNAKTATFRLGDNAAKRQYLGILSFSTKSLPNNAVITKVTLKVKKQGISGGGNPVTTFKGFMVDVKKGAFGTAALQASDFQTASSKTYGPFLKALSGGWYSIDLTAGKAYINKLNTHFGLTQIRLRFKLDDNNNKAANYLSLFSGNAPLASRPQLIIEYYVP